MEEICSTESNVNCKQKKTLTHSLFDLKSFVTRWSDKNVKRSWCFQGKAEKLKIWSKSLPPLLHLLQLVKHKYLWKQPISGCIDTQCVFTSTFVAKIVMTQLDKLLFRGTFDTFKVSIFSVGLFHLPKMQPFFRKHRMKVNRCLVCKKDDHISIIKVRFNIYSFRFCFYFLKAIMNCLLLKWIVV